MFDNFFFNTIIKKNHIKFSKDWHRNIKRISNYQVNKGIMDLRSGPITDLKDFRKAMAGDMMWEDVRIYRETKKIIANQKEWVQQQFDSNKSNTIGCEQKRQVIQVEVMETMNAIEKMGKKKATSYDEVMDVIFQKRYWAKMRNRLE